MILAYVFWHQPRLPNDRSGYEERLMAFHGRLADAPVLGLLGSRVLRVPDLPWLLGGGYEDWYYVDGFEALGRLNAAAVDDDHAAGHEPIATASGFGIGALYGLRSGGWSDWGADRTWFAKPPGVSYADLDARLGGPDGPRDGGSLWQRQLVLGPAPEYCLTGSPRFADRVADPVLRTTGTPVR